MTEADKLKLLQLETKYADSVLEHLKADRQLFKQLETNKEMKDQGLDFLMKHFVDTQAPHMKNYKSLADIDNAILELETVIKNKTLKEGRKLNATGGRVPLDGGGISQLVRPGKLGYAGEEKRELFGIPWEKIKELSKRKKTYDRKSPLAIPDDWLKRVKEKLSKADGGRVPLAGGKGVMSLLKLLQKKFPGTTKLGQTSKPMAPKTELKQSIAGFQEREAAANKLAEQQASSPWKPHAGVQEQDKIYLKETIEKKYRGKVEDEFTDALLRGVDADDTKWVSETMEDADLKIEILDKYKNLLSGNPEGKKLLEQMLNDKNPQRVREVMATIDQVQVMKNKGMTDDVIEEILGPSTEGTHRKHASGGRVSLSAGGLAGMLGE